MSEQTSWGSGPYVVGAVFLVLAIFITWLGVNDFRLFPNPPEPTSVASATTLRPSATPTPVPTPTPTPTPEHSASPTIRVSSEPPVQPIGPVFLGDLEPVRGTRVNTEPVYMDGIEYVKAVRMNSHPWNPYTVEYNLEGRYQRLTATIGFADSFETSHSWHYVITAVEAGVERTLFDEMLDSGEVSTVDIPVTGVRLIDFTIRRGGPSPISAGPALGYPFVWANPTLEP